HVRGFVCGNLFFKAQDVPKLIHAIEQAGFVEWINREFYRAVRERERLRFKIHGELGIRDFFDQVKQHFMSLFIYDDGDQSILQRVTAKNICKRCADDRAESVCGEGPRRMFTTRAASEVVTCQ